MSALTKSSSKRKRDATSLDEPPDWESMLDELELFPAHGAITRVAVRHGVSPRRLNRRWTIYRDAVQANDVATQRAMRGYYDRRRDNRLAVPRDVERRTIDSLLLTNPSPSRADVSAALVRAHTALPFMRRPSRSLPRVHSSYAASPSTVKRVLKQQRVIDKKVKLERTRVKPVTEAAKEEKLDECVRYLEDVEAACLTHGRSMVINVDETGIRTIRPPSHALARRGDWKVNRPVMKVTRSDRESTSLICAVAADGSKLRPCVLSSRRTEAALRRDRRWEAITCGGWTDAAVYMEYMERVILPYTGGRPATIVHDSLRSHHTPAVLSFLREHSLSSITIPPGETPTLQPLDVGIFGPLKAAARRRWREEKQRNTERPDTQLLSVSLHVEAFTQITRETVRRAWVEAVPALAVKPTRSSR